jgi:SAM-dependent methyltransferase
MAPELALEALGRAPRNAIVLDPMCGSGTVLQHARENGNTAFGFDIDPLAILVTRVTCQQVNGDYLQRAAARLVEDAQAKEKVYLPWMDSDPATTEFVDFWFHWKQQAELRRLAHGLFRREGKVADVLRVALSRTIITKDAGASLARDVSHSRPHRVRDTNNYDVYKGFLEAVRHLAPLVDIPAIGRVSVARRDARRLPPRLYGGIDLVITSPPYLNAIDYLRGHRLSLVWLGYQLGQLCRLRSNSVGAERYPDETASISKSLASRQKGLSPRQHGMLDRYAADMTSLMGQVAQVLSRRGEAVVVVGDSLINGTCVRNSTIIQRTAATQGLTLIDRRARPLPTSSRYLPPPFGTDGPLSKRMRREVIMRFKRTTRRTQRGNR